jgi:hypothetical protein
MKGKFRILVLFFVLAYPAAAIADSVSMSVSPAGKGVFLLTGENVVGVQSLDVDVEYDSTLLKYSYVLSDGGDVTSVNAPAPGKLLISVSREVAGPQLQIFLNFDAMADTPGGIYHVSAVVKSLAEKPAAPDTDLPPSGGTGNETMEKPAEISSTTGTNEASPPDGHDTKADSKRELEKRDMTETPSRPTGTTLKEGFDKKVPTAEITALTRDEKSVLQRFKKFKGKKTLNAFVELFEQSNSDQIVQTPAIALSDGKTPVRIVITPKSEVSHPVELGLADARLIAKEASEKDIVVTVLPIKGTWDARLVIMTGQKIIDCPLIVVPPVTFRSAINAANFYDSLQAYIVNQAPALQEENQQYIAEYIFTANYLAEPDDRDRQLVLHH